MTPLIFSVDITDASSGVKCVFTDWECLEEFIEEGVTDSSSAERWSTTECGGVCTERSSTEMV